MHPTTADYWFTTPTGSPGSYYLALTVGLGVLFVVSALVYWRRAKLAPNNAIMRRLLRRVSKAGLWLAGIGLFLAAMRWAQVDFLSVPFLMLLLILSMIATVGYFVYDLSERYPMAVYRLQEAQYLRRYRPEPRRQAEPVRARPAKLRGKRRR